MHAALLLTPYSRLVIAAVAWCVLGLGAPRAMAVDWEPWTPVTDTCGCQNPTDQVCTAYLTSCERRDTAIISTPGTPVGLLSAVNSCSNCPSCCDTNSCPSGYVLNCGVICAISFTKTKSSSIDSRLQAGIAPFIEAELLAHNGWESQSQLTVTGSCDINNVGPCTRVFAQAHLTYELGRKAIMYHEWRRAGTWGGTGCPIPPPAIWYVSCGSGASQVIINIATTWGCNVLCADKCGDECDIYEGGLPE